MSSRFFPHHFPPDHHNFIRPSNEHSPIDTLPNELLEIIFCASIPPPQRQYSKDRSEDECGRRALRASIHLASVSYRWHEVVHACPPMWGILHGELDYESVKLLLSKSKNAPLVIRCQDLDRIFARLIRPHIHRWRSFMVHTSILKHSEMRSLLTEAPAPLLESFEIGDTIVYNISEETVLFAGDAPQLQCLVVKPYYPTQWIPKGLSNLRDLQIFASHTSHPGTPSEFFHLLESSSPLLETLKIFESWSNISYEWVPSVVTFPELKHLWLQQKPPELVGFLFSFLRASSNPHIFVHAKYPRLDFLSVIFPPSISKDSPVVTAISRCQKLRISDNYRSFHIKGENLKIGDNLSDVGATQSDSMTQFELDISLGRVSTTRIYYLLSWSGCMTQITSLSLAWNNFNPELDVFNIFLSTENLVELHLEDGARGFSSTFFAFIATRQPSESGVVIWPCNNLLHLTMIRVDYDIQDIISCLRSRCENTIGTASCPPRLQTLMIQNLISDPPIPEEDINLLAKMVDSCYIREW
ncbi:hypothetical protein FRC03_001786 [Tulasnella sp. 419]|nr:hypothetical protein FRC03_001786 [Tulasnella sp. 419]